jgi:hypothetical protein
MIIVCVLNETHRNEYPVCKLNILIIASYRDKSVYLAMINSVQVHILALVYPIIVSLKIPTIIYSKINIKIPCKKFLLI